MVRGNVVAEQIVRFVFKAYFTLVHRVRVQGLENIPRDARRLIIISNHGSFLDGPLLWAYLPLKCKILVDRDIAQLPLLRPFMRPAYAVRVSALQPYSLKEALRLVEAGTPLLVYPEGRRSTTGGIMKIYEGAGFLADRTAATLLPVYIRNTYVAPTSRAPGKKRIFTRLTIVINAPRAPVPAKNHDARSRRKEAARRIYDLLCETRFRALVTDETLAQSVIRLCREFRGNAAFKDITGKKIGFGRSLVAAFLLAGYFSKIPGRTIGLLLPNLSVTVFVFFGLQFSRKIPAFLNYAAGPSSLKHMMNLADLKVIVTSREFLAKIGLDVSLFQGRQLLFLEDLQKNFSWYHKLVALWKSRFAGRHYAMRPGENKQTAVILFTSGSEGMPKGVVLSHENIVTNIYQCLARLDIRQSDYLLNALPIFHSFGLTVGVLMPFFAGARVFLYVSPLHFRVVPEAAYRENCTILIGTNVFLNGYAKKADPYDFYSMRYIYCGAEALLDPVFEAYARTFGIRVMSGYGATECSPVISLNNAVEYEHGTVGKILPGIEYRVAPVPGLEREGGGVLYVKGNNMMQGYLKNEAANRQYRFADKGWYDTGDIVAITDSGSLQIIGRRKRFAKVSGEMVSLTAIEEALAGTFGERKETAVIAAPDEKRGERIILVAASPAVTLPAARRLLSAKGFSEITQPREIRYVPRVPKLATGKVDYVALRELMNREEEFVVSHR